MDFPFLDLDMTTKCTVAADTAMEYLTTLKERDCGMYVHRRIIYRFILHVCTKEPADYVVSCLLGRRGRLCPKKLMCPPAQWVKVHVQ